MMQNFLKETPVVDFKHREILALADEIERKNGASAYAAVSFSWVKNEVLHSGDCDIDVVTCVASDVLRERVGFCYAKSHLLVALLRARRIPAGFVYQRLALDKPGTFCLHGIVGVWHDGAWYRADPRGGQRGAHALFAPPIEHRVFHADREGEWTSSTVLADPLPVVVESLCRYKSARVLLANLPDLQEVSTLEN
jgi:transglutaminase-like putative cysteine protease